MSVKGANAIWQFWSKKRRAGQKRRREKRGGGEVLRDRVGWRGGGSIWGGVLDEREIGDELDTDKAGMRNIGGEGLKRRYCRDSIVTHCRKWPLRAIAFYLCDILKVQIFQHFLKIHRWSLDLKAVAEGWQSFGLRYFIKYLSARSTSRLPRESLTAAILKICLWGNSRSTLKALRSPAQCFSKIWGSTGTAGHA